MIKTYKAVVNDHITVDLATSDAIASKVSDYGNVTGLLQEEKVEASLLERNFDTKTYTIRLRGSIYNVTLQNTLDQQIESMGLSLGSQTTTSIVVAPMPGLILSVLVKEGDTVTEGDGLLVLEAMKMENKLVAPRDGVIKAVHIVTNQTVDKEMVLIEYEDEDEN